MLDENVLRILIILPERLEQHLEVTLGFDSAVFSQGKAATSAQLNTMQNP